MSFKRTLPILLILFVSIALLRAVGFWDDGLPYNAINHGDHKHYMPKDKDENIGLDDCPTHPPDAESILTSQCQIVRKVKEGNATYYVPEQMAEGVAASAFPTRPPNKGERIAPDGKFVAGK